MKVIIIIVALLLPTIIIVLKPFYSMENQAWIHPVLTRHNTQEGYTYPQEGYLRTGGCSFAGFLITKGILIRRRNIFVLTKRILDQEKENLQTK